MGLKHIVLKEFRDILQERVYIFTFFLQIFIVVGILILGNFYSEIEKTVNSVGNVYVETDDLNFLESLKHDKRVTIVEKNQDATIILKNNVLEIEAPSYLETDLIKIVKEVYKNKSYKWHYQKTPVDAAFIEVMNTVLIPLILLMPIFISMNILSDSIVAEKQRKTLEIMLATPLKRYQIVLGKIVPLVILTISQIIFWLGLIYIKYRVLYNFFILILFLILLMVFFFTITVVFSTVSKSLRESNIFLTLFLMVMTFLMFIPIPEASRILKFSPLRIIVYISSNPGLIYYEVFEYFFLYGVFVIFTIFAADRVLGKDDYTML